MLFEFQGNRFKQTTVDKSVHSANFSQGNLKHRGKFLRVISGPSKMDVIEAGLTGKPGRKTLMIILKYVIYHENIFYFPFI